MSLSPIAPKRRYKRHDSSIVRFCTSFEYYYLFFYLLFSSRTRKESRRVLESYDKVAASATEAKSSAKKSTRSIPDVEGGWIVGFE